MSPRDVVRRPLSSTATPRSRSLDERLYVRFPSLLPHVVSAVMRLRPRSRVRQAFVSLLVTRGWAASDRGDLELCLGGYDPNVEIVWPKSGSQVFPDLRGSYRGHEGYKRVWQAMHDPWDLEVRLEEVIDAGAQLVVIGHFTARGKGSGVNVGGPLAVLQTLRAGRIVREQFFNDRNEALEAAGLSE